MSHWLAKSDLQVRTESYVVFRETASTAKALFLGSIVRAVLALFLQSFYKTRSIASHSSKATESLRASAGVSFPGNFCDTICKQFLERYSRNDYVGEAVNKYCAGICSQQQKQDDDHSESYQQTFRSLLLCRCSA